jgi:Transposase zinc-binding domain
VPRPALELADIFREHGPAWREANAGHVSLDQLKVMSAIENCRTAALGGHVLRCEKCEHIQIAYNSCRNRHCPKCQGAAAQEWLAEREAELLPVPYFHVVFSLPAHDRGRPKASRRPHRHLVCSPYLGIGAHSEPSLRIPGIIISLIFQ